MNDRSFYRLSPFIQEYIYTHGWTELRPVQIEACRVIFETTYHLLLAAGTAAGKTEAAFLPILTLLQENPSTSIGVLYISPIKALINDQFERLDDLLKTVEVPVWKWHGDVSQYQKNKVFATAEGILQITPESLESLLINKNSDLVHLLGDLRFIVIDEIHAFMGSERGCQILCQLSRLSKIIQKTPRRIGLSATLGDYSLAEAWLSAGTDISTTTPEIKGGQRPVNLAVEHFYLSSEEEVEEKNQYYQYLFESSKLRKCLIFANSRMETESAIANLRRIATDEKLPDIYHVHHGSISASLREAAEVAMKEPDYPAVTAATVTLELGIDIGQLERVIQLEAPFSVSSFLQRLGRSGRRGEPADMRLVFAEKVPSKNAFLSDAIPWQLLQAIAIIQLYSKERWIEPIQPLQYPWSLLYHQTMSTLAARGELSPSLLVQDVLTLPPFAAISQEDYRKLLNHLILIDHIQQTEQGLIIGLAGEKVVRKFPFYAVFQNEFEYTVKDDFREIGSIGSPPAIKKQFTLAGRTWEVVDIDRRRKTVLVKGVEGLGSISWRGGNRGTIHSKILQEMKVVLCEDILYPYLQVGAKKRLEASREKAKLLQLDKTSILPIGENNYCIFPWMGTTAYKTLERYLSTLTQDNLQIKKVSGNCPYFLTVQMTEGTLQDLHQAIVSFNNVRGEALIDAEENLKLQKYDEFIPETLLKKAFINTQLNIEEVERIVRTW